MQYVSHRRKNASFPLIFESMEGKRIVFSTASPNDQGGIIPNECIDFKRFKKNPVVLCQHDWNAPPLGKMVDIKLENGKYTGLPVFHRLTPESTVYADLYEAGYINACSIGGEAEWKTNGAGQTVLKDGFRQCEKFNLYEISIVTLPSNPDATTMEAMAAKVYDKAELRSIYSQILTLSSPFKISEMKKTPAQIHLAALQTALAAAKAQAEPDADTVSALESGIVTVQKVVDEEKAKLAATGVLPNDPSAAQLPGVIKDLFSSFGATVVDIIKAVSGGKTINATAPAIKGDQGTSSIVEVTKTEQPNPTGLEAKQAEAKKKAEEAKEHAANCINATQAAKAAAEKEGATDVDRTAYATAFSVSEAACNAALEADEEYKSCMDGDDDGDEVSATKTKNATGATKVTAAAKPKPVLKTLEQLKADNVKLAPKPEHNPAGARVVKMRGTRFTDLSAKKNEEGNRIINRVMTTDGGVKSLEDYRIVMESIMADGKYSAMCEQLRVIENVDESKLQSYRNDKPLRKDRKGGKTVEDIMQQLESGEIEALNAKSGRMERTTLNSTDNALAAPALTTIEWLSLAIFELFPSTSWKDDISMFPADMTSRNTGLIWANITAQPTVYRGTQPVNPADYQNTDAAQSLTLIPYYLQPMLWNPLNTHQLRYDVMSLQWAQAFAYWGSVMDDELIYILSSTVPISSVIQSGGYATKPSFSLANGVASPDSFYYNPAYTGALATPAYNDIAIMEQIMNNQNFDLAREKMQVVLDPTMLKYIKQDPLTQSLLTRWIESNSGDLLKISNTKLNMRSRVAAIDQAGLLANPATVQIKDPTGIMPATVMSCALGFISSQVALGLGMLDVFMIQSPSSYGFRMSADIRIGAVPVRTNANGTFLYTYGQPTI